MPGQSSQILGFVCELAELAKSRAVFGSPYTGRNDIWRPEGVKGAAKSNGRARRLRLNNETYIRGTSEWFSRNRS